MPLTKKLSADDAVEANDALVAFVANEADTACKTYDAVVANEALVALSATEDDKA